MGESRPWLRFYGTVPATIAYPQDTLYEVVMRTVRRTPDAVAFDFLGRTATYHELGETIDRCADGLASLGLGPGDRITIATPTCPQGVIAFYAATKLGAVPSMIHPLSTADEIRTYLNLSNSRVALTLDALYDRFAEARARTPLETLILMRIQDYLPVFKRIGYWWTRGRKISAPPADATVRWWAQLMAEDHPPAPTVAVDTHDPAAILYSGGTTGTPKGIVLSHQNFISEGLQVATWVSLGERDVVLAVLPIFHGFGLGALVHTSFMSGARVVMVPIFSPKVVAELIRTKRPTMMAGVPTLYEALSRDPSLQRADLSCLRAAFCGADTLTRPVKEGFEQLIRERGGNLTLLEGYGLTEAVTAIMGTPLHAYREGSVGVPFPDMDAKICRPGTDLELPPGEEGEICVSGPPVMIGYLDNPEATGNALRVHRDGRTWLHTEDLGRTDEDGFFYFTARLKRMIKSSGFNVYPAEVEAVLCQHSAVESVCVVGVPDQAQGQRVKAFIVLDDDYKASPELAAELIDFCRARLIKWSCPRDVAFRRDLPQTRLGKVDYVALEREEAASTARHVPARSAR
jgi:long-chain acyl-CoA synthetase